MTFYIPKKFRNKLLDKIISKEDQEAIDQRCELKKKITDVNGLEYRLNLKPGRNGFVIDDSFFEENSKYLEEPYNPNRGF